MSVLLRPVLDPGQLHLCTAAVALAAAAACRVTAGVEPDVKWPNDLVLGGAKLAGVLAESDAAAPGGPAGSVAVVVGVGLNVDWPGPDGAGGTCLADHVGGADTADHTDGGVDREEVLVALLAELEPRAEALESAEGRQRLATELRLRCRTLGQPVRVDLAEGPVEGTAVDLTPEGHLVVATAVGRRTVVAGDVVHLRPSGGGPSGGGPSGGGATAH